MKKKWKLILGLILAAAVVVFFAVNNTKGLEAGLLEVQPRSIAKTFKEEGIVVSDQEKPIYATNGGKVKELPVQEGQTVTAGDLLIAFESSELVFQLEQLQGQLKSVKAQHDQQKAEISLDKLKQLYEAGAISKKEYEDAQNTVNSQYFPGLIESLQAQISLIQFKIDESSIHAPADGIVSALEVKEGMVVLPGTQVMTVFHKDAYRVETYILTEDAARVTPGTKVNLIQDNKSGDIVFGGEVEKVAPSAVEKISALGLVEQRVKVTIRADIPENLDLRPGYALDVEFTIDKQDNSLVVPKTALFPYRDGEAVWLVQNNKARVQPVKKGFENDRDAAIIEGLQAGDFVLLNPQLEGLKEGKKIIAK